MNEIPKIIHQIWYEITDPLPKPFKELGETWKDDYPDWKYEFWDNERIHSFIQEYYPQYWDVFCKYPFHIQRCDAIRYLILDKMGGMYVDFDYESVKPIDKLVQGKSCCFAKEKTVEYNGLICFNNALMLSTPNHPFIKKIVDYVFSEKRLTHNTEWKKSCVFETTGPLAIMQLYDLLDEEDKGGIYLIAAKYVTPFDAYQASLVRHGKHTQELDDCLEEAYAVHYYCSVWATDRL